MKQFPFHNFTLFVILSLFTGGSPNASRKYSACVGGTGREKIEDNKKRKIIKWDRPGLTYREHPCYIKSFDAKDRYSKPSSNDEGPLHDSLTKLPSCCEPRRNQAKA